MSYKVAFASRDGKLVDQNFGKVDKFLIFQVGDNGVEYLETRNNKPHFYKCKYHEESIYKLVNLISDCKAVFVTNIGYMALAILKVNGIRAFEAPCYINEIIEQILSSTLKI